MTTPSTAAAGELADELESRIKAYGDSAMIPVPNETMHHIIAALRTPSGARDGWRPIETAPKDGTRILVLTVHGEIEITEWFTSTHFEYVEVENGLYRKESLESISAWNSNTPTHWQPLPAPPSTASGAAREEG